MKTAKRAPKLPGTTTDAVASTPRPTPAPLTPSSLISDPTLAAALFHAWSGDPLIVVASPPGAGKTFLITHLAQQLAERAGLRVAIAGQTRAQSIDVASRIAALGAKVAFRDGTKNPRPHDLHPGVIFRAGKDAQDCPIVVATSARWMLTPPNGHRADIFLVDEAYQMTYSTLGALAAFTSQIVLVGDPGQIAPVVTGATERWSADASGPQVPAPDALLAAYGEQVTRLALPQTRRLGPMTTDLIAPAFYPALPFTSARPQIDLVNADGTLVPELTCEGIAPSSTHDPLIAHTAAARVRELLATCVMDADGSHPMTPADIAVVTPHVHQAAQTSALLADLGPDVLIGTTNSLQGSERAGVVVVHPMTGAAEVTAFNLDPGRACVALSRHRAHASVIYDTRVPAMLAAAQHADPGNPLIPVHRRLLEDLDAR